jgi:hypothetical protein
MIYIHVLGCGSAVVRGSPDARGEENGVSERSSQAGGRYPL